MHGPALYTGPRYVLNPLYVSRLYVLSPLYVLGRSMYWAALCTGPLYALTRSMH